MSEIDRSRQAALQALLSAARGKVSDRFIASAIEIAYANQFSPEDRGAAKRALREAVQTEAQSRQVQR